jgi:hypothetical protein
VEYVGAVGSAVPPSWLVGSGEKVLGFTA